jgi:hypothetical protein
MEKIQDFVDVMKDEINTRKKIEGNAIDKNIIEFELISDGAAMKSEGICVSTSIGSGFYFHIEGHNLFESPSSLIGDMRGGSVVKTF